MKRLLIAAVAAACLVVPAAGQEATCDRTIDGLIALMESLGHDLAGAMPYEGATTDGALIIEGDELVMLFTLSGDCVVAGPILLDTRPEQVGV